MPSVQRGQRFKLKGGSWAIRWYDAEGRRHQRGGFKTKGEAGDVLESELDRVRLGPLADVREQQEQRTLRELVTAYVGDDEQPGQHQADPVTITKLRRELAQAIRAFGEDKKLAELNAHDLGAWRARLSEGSRHNVFRALRQALEQAVRWKWIDENPAKAVKNPKPRPPEIAPFESWDVIAAIEEELDPRFAAIPTFAAGTGLRPEEWIALERRDVDRAARVVTVERVYSQFRLKQCAKSSRQRRRVWLPEHVLEALDRTPPRLDSPLLFPAARGGYIELGSGGATIGRRRSGPPASSIVASTTSGTPSPASRSPPVSLSSTWRGSWARR
jgi:integrase